MGFPGDDEVLDVHPSMSPKGVEHKNVRGLGVVEASVHPSMSPKGVEHTERQRFTGSTSAVHPSMSPKGVEHRENSAGFMVWMCASINVAERR